MIVMVVVALDVLDAVKKKLKYSIIHGNI